MTVSGCFPSWGPYGKKYMGLSHIANHSFAKGVRFDITTVPALFGGDIRIPNVTLPSDCHPWQFSADYSLVTYRHDLLRKDEVYSYVSYVRLSEDSTLIRTEFINNSALIQNCLINYFESAEYPTNTYCKLILPDKNIYIKALDYDIYSYAEPRPWDQQNPDGYKKGEFEDERFIGGFGLGDRVGKWHMPHRYLPPFGAVKGDAVSYTLNIPEVYEDAVLTVRYRTSSINYEPGKMVGVNVIQGDNAAEFLLNDTYRLTLAPADDLAFARISLGKLEKGKLQLNFSALGTGGAEFDFLCITERENCEEIGVQTMNYDYIPSIKTEKVSDAAGDGYRSGCKFPDIDGVYHLRTFNGNTRFRHIATGSLEDCMTARLSNSDPSFDDVTESFTGAFSRKHSDDGFFLNTIVHTIFVEPGTSHIEYAVISRGDAEYKTEQDYEKIYEERKKNAINAQFNKSGKGYELSVNILRATLMANAVYPIYKHGEYIIHHTPGKRWDCLYTWDSGFIGLGMLDIAPSFAEYSLETYLSDNKNPDYAFLHHGSPVPVQMYLYLEMLKRETDKSKLFELYDRLKLYYDFLAGKIRGSTTAKFKSGLTTTYDYFYSSSGMDDYPAQVEMMDREIRDTAAPVISSSQLIRCAKILSMVASKTGKTEEAAIYNEDILKLTDALNNYAWDAESGYYGYVLHNEQYLPVELMRTDKGENFNKGLDGIYPLIAGVCDETQKSRILGHLKNENEMLSPYGISAVDMSAGYFKVNGYWNGNVWFPHQWFIWKSLLDLGETEFAYEIARRALNIWKREVDDSYYTFEMVNVVTGRGGWFHNFGGLSTPISMWANAYYTPGTFNTGFDTWVDKAAFSDDNTHFSGEITCFGNNNKSTVIIVLNEKYDYSLTLDGTQLPFNKRENGLIEAELSLSDNEIHTIEVKLI
ncbi:MAG: hypothetical protein J1E34_08935 [Oscillospiraceae bacterium]|nr:hypothetical protein [Oscillospiraceae bacterium]